MNKDQLDGLLALKVVAEKLNFAAAASELGISPSAVTQIIKQLENRVGVALLNRTTRSTSLTEAGKRFLDQAGPALDQILSALENVDTYSGKPSGVLRLNMPRLIYPNFVAPIISSFSKKYPEISVQIVFDDGASDIVKGGFDAGIRLSDILIKDMVAIKLFGPAKFVVAGSPKYFEKMGRPKHPHDLLNHNCIIPGSIETHVYDHWDFEQKGKDFAVKVKGNLMFNDSNLIQIAAVDSLGVIYTIEEAIADKLKSGKLEIVLSQFAASSTGFFLYFASHSQVQPKLRAFIDHMKAELSR
jgi:DNA-binding transcriptional LysR family regulator